MVVIRGGYALTSISITRVNLCYACVAKRHKDTVVWAEELELELTSKMTPSNQDGRSSEPHEETRRLAVQPCCASTFTKRYPTRCPQGGRQRSLSQMPEGNQYEHIAVSGSGRQHFGDSHYTANTTNNYYPLRQRRSDETIRYDRRGGRLLEAAKDGQRLRLQYLLQELGVSVDHEDERGLTALHYAAWSGYCDCVEFLINKGAYVNAHSDKYGTPLCLAVVKDHLDVVKLLVEEHRVNVNADGGFFGSALHTSCNLPKGGTPLRTKIVELLLSYGAQVRSRKRVGIVFLYAVQRNLPVPDQPNGNHGVELLCDPIHIAASSTCLDVLNLLTDNGADVNAKAQYLSTDEVRPETPLEISCVRDAAAPLVLLLLRRGASYQPRGSHSAAHAAAQYSPKCLQVLLENGCSPNIVRSDGGTPLMIAAGCGNAESVRLLFRFGANVFMQSQHGDTALSRARESTERGAAECVAHIELLQRHLTTSPLFQAPPPP